MRATGVFVLFCCFALTTSFALPKKKPFHQHLEDFFGVVLAESGLELERLLRQYGENREFGITATYFETNNFRDLFHDVQQIPEFKAMTEYLENASIDINYMLGSINDLIDKNKRERLNLKQRNEEGRNQTSCFIRESIKLLPKDKLSQLFEQKKAESASFRHAAEKLDTPEMKQLFENLLQNRDFKTHMDTLAQNGVDVRLFIEQVKTLFGKK